MIPLLIEAGITLLWPLERAAGTDPLKIRQQYGHDLCLGGGFDKRALIEGPAAIEQEMARLVPQLLDDGVHLVTIDHRVPPDVSYESFLYYMRLKIKVLGMGDAPW